MQVCQVECKWRKESTYSTIRNYHLLFAQDGNKNWQCLLFYGTLDINNKVNCWKTIWYNNYSRTKDYKAESKKLLVIPQPRDIDRG